MKSKIVSLLLVASLLFYIGCYNTEMLKKEKLKDNLEQDINVIAKDSLEYKFYKGDYSIQNDTLSGTGVQMIEGWPTDKHFNGSMALSEIAQVKTVKLDVVTTIGSIVLGLGFVIGLRALLIRIPIFPILTAVLKVAEESVGNSWKTKRQPSQA
jgi:hypothetical protein